MIRFELSTNRPTFKGLRSLTHSHVNGATHDYKWGAGRGDPWGLGTALSSRQLRATFLFAGTWVSRPL